MRNRPGRADGAAVGYVTACDRGRAVRALGRGARKRARDRDDGRGTADGLLARPHARADVLRSGPDWHLDAAVCTRSRPSWKNTDQPEEVDPIPLDVFLDYSDWFRSTKRSRSAKRSSANVQVERPLRGHPRQRQAHPRRRPGLRPGIRHYTNLPGLGRLAPARMGAHTCDLVRFEELAGARVLIVGGRQSAYEWAALIREHGAERIDIVHRHAVPTFRARELEVRRPHVEQTDQDPRVLAQPSTGTNRNGSGRRSGRSAG